MRHMMTKAVMALVMFAWACGDAPFDDAPFDGVCPEGSTHPDCAAPADAGELGTLEQPIIIHGEHGTASNQGPCTHPFPGGECFVPDQKGNIIAWHPYTCNRDLGGKSGAWWYQAVARGLYATRDYLVARGWPTEVVTLSSEPPWSVGNIQFRCDYGSGSIGQTSVNEFGGSPFDCHDTPHGDLCQYKAGVITIRPQVAVNSVMWNQTTTAQKSNMLYNVGFHEGLHYAGLPHRPHNSNNMNIMMPAIQAWLSTQWTTRMVPDVNQSLSLYCYVHTSSTTPIVGCSAN